jgi:DNA polymerase/3'-5' exonuclease PolX
MVVSDNQDAIQLLLERLTDILNGKIYPYSKGKDKMSLIVDMSELLNSENKVYKIDAFRTTKEEQVPMLLYSTGSKEFNVTMRSKAKKLGYLLNQKGLFKNGTKVPDLNTEKAYFDVLGMEYLEPSKRI